MKKILIAISFLIFLFFIFLILYFPPKEIFVQNFLQEEKIEKVELIKLVFVGDVMFDRGVEYSINKNGGGDFKYPLLKVGDYLKNADLLFGNLESVISDKGYNVGSIYSFRADPQAIDALTYGDFDVVSLANNHMFDYTTLALKDTMDRLTENNIAYVGAGINEQEAFSLKVLEPKGLRVGFLAYTNLGSSNWRAGENSSGIAWISDSDLENIESAIKTAKEKVDLLVVSCHSGDEYALEPNLFQKEFYRAFIDAGADLVIGHHPHVIESVEQYKNGYIAYSLGNFVFDQSFSEETMKGLLLEVFIENGKIKKVNQIKTKQNSTFQVELSQE